MIYGRPTVSQQQANHWPTIEQPLANCVQSIFLSYICFLCKTVIALTYICVQVARVFWGQGRIKVGIQSVSRMYGIRLAYRNPPIIYYQGWEGEMKLCINTASFHILRDRNIYLLAHLKFSFKAQENFLLLKLCAAQRESQLFPSNNAIRMS